MATFYEMISEQLLEFDRRQRQDEELFDELFRFMRGDQRAQRDGLWVTRKEKVATVGQAKQTLCTFVVKGGGILVTGADGQTTTTFADRDDAALKHVANLVAVAWRTAIAEEAVA